MFLSLALLAACEDTAPTFLGTTMSPYFPMDGDRQAEYNNEDVDNVTWQLFVEKIEPTERVNDEEVVTFEWSNGDSGELVGAVKWSATSGEGIKIHAYADGTGDFITFDTPVLVTDDDDKMSRNESVTTETNGYTFVSTLVGPENCPVDWGLDWENCLHINLDDGDGDDMTGPIFAGDYWLVQRYGPAWMQLTGYTEKWNLAHYDWEAAE
jgi:hypothetical protein